MVEAAHPTPPTGQLEEEQAIGARMRECLEQLPVAESLDVVRAICSGGITLYGRQGKAVTQTILAQVPGDMMADLGQGATRAAYRGFTQLGSALDDDEWPLLEARVETTRAEMDQFIESLHGLPAARRVRPVHALLNLAGPFRPKWRECMYRTQVAQESRKDIASDLNMHHARVSSSTAEAYREVVRYATPDFKRSVLETEARETLASLYTPNELRDVMRCMTSDARVATVKRALKESCEEGTVEPFDYDLVTWRFVDDRAPSELMATGDVPRMSYPALKVKENRALNLLMPCMDKAMFQRLSISSTPAAPEPMTNQQLWTRMRELPSAIRLGLLESLRVRTLRARYDSRNDQAAHDLLIENMTAALETDKWETSPHLDRGLSMCRKVLGVADMAVFDAFRGYKGEATEQDYLDVAAEASFRAGGRPYEPAPVDLPVSEPIMLRTDLSRAVKKRPRPLREESVEAWVPPTPSVFKDCLTTLPYQEAAEIVQVLRETGLSFTAKQNKIIEAMLENQPPHATLKETGARSYDELHIPLRKLARALDETAWDYLQTRAIQARAEAERWVTGFRSLPLYIQKVFTQELLDISGRFAQSRRDAVTLIVVRGKEGTEAARELGWTGSVTYVVEKGFLDLARYVPADFDERIQAALDKDASFPYTPKQIQEVLRYMPEASRRLAMEGALAAAVVERRLSPARAGRLARRFVEGLTALEVGGRSGEGLPALEAAGPCFDDSVLNRLDCMVAPKTLGAPGSEELKMMFRALPQQACLCLLESLCVRSRYIGPEVMQVLQGEFAYELPRSQAAKQAGILEHSATQAYYRALREFSGVWNVADSAAWQQFKDSEQDITEAEYLAAAMDTTAREAATTWTPLQVTKVPRPKRPRPKKAPSVPTRLPAEKGVARARKSETTAEYLLRPPGRLYTSLVRLPYAASREVAERLAGAAEVNDEQSTVLEHLLQAWPTEEIARHMGLPAAHVELTALGIMDALTAQLGRSELSQLEQTAEQAEKAAAQFVRVACVAPVNLWQTAVGEDTQALARLPQALRQVLHGRAGETSGAANPHILEQAWQQFARYVDMPIERIEGLFAGVLQHASGLQDLSLGSEEADYVWHRLIGDMSPIGAIGMVDLSAPAQRKLDVALRQLKQSTPI